MHIIQPIYVFSSLSANCGCKRAQFQTDEEQSTFKIIYNEPKIKLSWFYDIPNQMHKYALWQNYYQLLSNVIKKTYFHLFPEMPYLMKSMVVFYYYIDNIYF